MTKIQAEAFFNDDAEDSGAKILFKKIYGEGGDVFSRQSARYLSLAEDFDSRFGGGQFRIFSAPGRSEIGGNHTDHNNGKVLAASIQLDVIAAASPTFDNRITISDKTFHEEFTVDCAEDFEETAGRGSAALIRGLVNGFKKAGYKAGGFNACLESEIPAGSGVSSSAAFEMLLCCILNTFYNNGEIPFEKWAAIGRYAENVFWGKSSGLLDQIACAAGGMAAIDFKNPESPLITKIQFDFSEEAYNLILVGTGGSHEDLSKEYSIIPGEMKSIAKHFGENVLREAHEDDVIANIEALRNNFGDRAVLRALHFYEENIRVEKEIESLAKNDFMQFLAYVNESGNSSYKYLQNVHTGSVTEQNIPLALQLTEMFIRRNNLQGKAASRVHGGGFAGVIQVYLPRKFAAPYKDYMANVFGGNVFIMAVRPCGVIEVSG